MDAELQREARGHESWALDATSARRQIQHNAHPFSAQGIRKCRAELDPDAWYRPAILHLHLRDGLAVYLPINEMLTKGNPMAIGFLLCHIEDPA